MPRSVHHKTVLALVSAAAVLMGAAGSTVAWLASRSTPVENTFTYGTIGLTLQETDTLDPDGDPNTNTYSMAIGASIEKDPTVVVDAGSEAAWLFVKLDKSATFDSYLAYAPADGWTALQADPNVWWRKVESLPQEQSFDVLAGNAVHVKPEVTEHMLNQLAHQPLPSISFTAYAVQQTGIPTANEAWPIALAQAPNP